MSSVLIKGMKKPKNCDKCILSSSVAVRCDAAKKSLVDTYPKIPSWCPLVEVSEPHGRLIDVDKIFNALRISKDIDDESKAKFMNLLIESPTVTEAEGQEHE